MEPTTTQSTDDNSNQIILIAGVATVIVVFGIVGIVVYNSKKKKQTVFKPTTQQPKHTTVQVNPVAPPPAKVDNTGKILDIASSLSNIGVSLYNQQKNKPLTINDI